MVKGLQGLLASRKVWAAAIAWIVGMLTQAVAIYASFRGWTPEMIHTVNTAIQISAIGAMALGAIVAWLWSRESWARDWGVVEPRPEELQWRATLIQEAVKSMTPEALKVLAEVVRAAPQRLDRAVD